MIMRVIIDIFISQCCFAAILNSSSLVNCFHLPNSLRSSSALLIPLSSSSLPKIMIRRAIQNLKKHVIIDNDRCIVDSSSRNCASYLLSMSLPAMSETEVRRRNETINSSSYNDNNDHGSENFNGREVAGATGAGTVTTVNQPQTKTNDIINNNGNNITKGPSSKAAMKSSVVKIASTIEELLDIMNGCGHYNDYGNSSRSQIIANSNIIQNDSSSSSPSLTLILFYAHYCKICQRATMNLSRLSREYPAINFAKVEASVFPTTVAISTTYSLHSSSMSSKSPSTSSNSAHYLKSIGVSKFPYVHIYRNGDCVASFSTGPTHMFMKKVRETLDLCLERNDGCWSSFVQDFRKAIQSNRLARQELLLVSSSTNK